jgi:hypothetical protein
LKKAMSKKPSNKKSANETGARSVGRFCKRVPPDHPIYKIGFAVGGRYPARKKQPTEREELERIAAKLAVERNGDPTDEDIQRDAVFQVAAQRARQPNPAVKDRE